MIDIETEFQLLLKELEVEIVSVPKNLARLIFQHGVLIGIKYSTEKLIKINDTAELIDLAKKLIEKGDKP